MRGILVKRNGCGYLIWKRKSKIESAKAPACRQAGALRLQGGASAAKRGVGGNSTATLTESNKIENIDLNLTS
jgi:hypothetical protein